MGADPANERRRKTTKHEVTTALKDLFVHHWQPIVQLFGLVIALNVANYTLLSTRDHRHELERHRPAGAQSTGSGQHGFGGICPDRRRLLHLRRVHDQRRNEAHHLAPGTTRQQQQTTPRGLLLGGRRRRAVRLAVGVAEFVAVISPGPRTSTI